MKILATAKMRGSANCLNPIVKELQKRQHDVHVIATGNKNEEAGFTVDHEHIPWHASQIDYDKVIEGFDALLTGLSGIQSPDGLFIKAASKMNMPCISVLDVNAGIQRRIQKRRSYIPSAIAVPDQDSIDSVKKALGKTVGPYAAEKCHIVGWPAFDSLAVLRDYEPDSGLITKLGLNKDFSSHVHFTQNLFPEGKYLEATDIPMDQRRATFSYELCVTERILDAANKIGLKIAVKPHPGEEGDYTKSLAKEYSHHFIPAQECNSRDLMASVRSVSAGRSTCITEACLLGINSGAFVPDIPEQDLAPFPAISTKAVPYSRSWSDAEYLLRTLTTNNPGMNQRLAQQRKMFQVDGKAAQRVADIIETYSR